jgi:hypothetical protein
MQLANFEPFEPTTPDLAEVTREVVETVLGIFDKGHFDWHEDSWDVSRLLFTYGILCESATAKRALEEAGKVAAINALEEARKAISFEALNDRPAPKGAFAHFQKVISGHCTHRAKTILAEMIRELEDSR